MEAAGGGPQVGSDTPGSKAATSTASHSDDSKAASRCKRCQLGLLLTSLLALERGQWKLAGRGPHPVSLKSSTGEPFYQQLRQKFRKCPKRLEQQRRKSHDEGSGDGSRQDRHPAK